MKLFLDLDGVLADFDAGVVALLGRQPDALSKAEMWRAIALAPEFFASLPWTTDGKRLWDFCRKLQPTILTGLPRGNWAEAQKRRWVTEMLGPDVPVITCMTSQKLNYAAPRHVLVDDRIHLRKGWVTKGGIFVHHVSAIETISALYRVMTKL